MNPTNGEGHGAGHDVALKTHNNEHHDSGGDQPARQDFDAEIRHFARLREALASSGYTLSPLACGGYLIARRDLTRNAPDLRAVRRFLSVIGGAI
jgi:hypothetical protein